MSLQCRTFGAAALHVGPPHSLQAAQCFQEQINPLFLYQPAHIADDKPPAGRLGLWPEDLWVHAELGDDGQFAPVPLGPPHADRFLVAGNGIVGVAQHVALQEAERSGIAALDILPGEEQALGP